MPPTIETDDNKQAIVQWVITALLVAVVGLAGLNARSYVEGIAAEVYAENGLPPSETKARLVEIETKLAGVEGNVSEIREDIRTLIDRL